MLSESTFTRLLDIEKGPGLLLAGSSALQSRPGHVRILNAGLSFFEGTLGLWLCSETKRTTTHGVSTHKGWLLCSAPSFHGSGFKQPSRAPETLDELNLEACHLSQSSKPGIEMVAQNHVNKLNRRSAPMGIVPCPPTRPGF